MVADASVVVEANEQSLLLPPVPRHRAFTAAFSASPSPPASWPPSPCAQQEALSWKPYVPTSYPSRAKVHTFQKWQASCAAPHGAPPHHGPCAGAPEPK